ncbi:hypothetical protein GW17_00013547 [Ensete ventricosum]|nr:hypothetical protein GW17_00013547 [Ensete ventricosum]RZS19609.1 hypothetical protein BHM03_00052027 [Ensete ventricosum]
MQGRPGRLRSGPACKGGRRCPQGATDASGLQADYGRPPIGHRGCRQQGQCPPAVSPQRGDAHGGAANGSRPQGRLPAGKAAIPCTRAMASARLGRSRRMVMRRFDGTNDDEINNHRA